jgi:NAD(P)-dependent dehydrogenase (short-subunit alcohol dehydrogenase family)
MAVNNGRVALVTGSSRGLGAVIARRLASDGLAVAVNGRPGDEQVSVVSRAIRDDGGAAEAFCADVTDEHQVAGLVAAITDVPDHVRKAYLASVPAGRMGTPADIAHAVSFLASEGAGFITGQRIVVDGGRSLGG